MEMFKDDVLAELARSHNVAQFVSFDPDLRMRHILLHTPKITDREQHKRRMLDRITTLLLQSNDQTLNIRSFLPNRPQGNPFITNLKNPVEVVSIVRCLASQGFYTVVHEAIDVSDGGVSGVSQNGYMEFSPGVTPRGVENSQSPMTRLPEEVGVRILQQLYGIDPEHLPATKHGKRLEFSVHLRKLGVRNSNVILWELHPTPEEMVAPRYIWPTEFSKMIGDKAFGLMLAAELGFPVPHATTYFKDARLPACSFGTPIPGEVWLRTCPPEPVPGKFPTVRGVADPFQLMADHEVVSCIAQHEVPADWSGGVTPMADGTVVVEGVKGFGDQFMLGSVAPQPLPEGVESAVMGLYGALSTTFGVVKIEWAIDPQGKVWLLQINIVQELSLGKIIYPGDPVKWQDFHPSRGLAELAAMVKELPRNQGIQIIGNIGMSSHIADVLRRERVPSRVG